MAAGSNNFADAMPARCRGQRPAWHGELKHNENQINNNEYTQERN